jgi:hypothetical protein
MTGIKYGYFPESEIKFFDGRKKRKKMKRVMDTQIPFTKQILFLLVFSRGDMICK